MMHNTFVVNNNLDPDVNFDIPVLPCVRPAAEGWVKICLK